MLKFSWMLHRHDATHTHTLSVAVVNPSPKRNQFLSPRDEEERRRLLKQLVAPKESKDKSKRRASVFDSMIIKAARSAENLPVTEATAGAALSPSFPAEAGGRDNFRKESTASLQVCLKFPSLQEGKYLSTSSLA